jgi:POT family proton-dependent oligopeptide transporter
MNSVDNRDWFGQPRGLTVLFLTQMWTEFSYFGMRALLVYYMTRQLLMSQPAASLIYGIYTAAVFLTPIAGGVIADRWLGRRRAVILGGSLMATGHFLMTFEPMLFPALAIIAIGNGLFLPSLPGQISALYRPDDPRRASAYTVYYIGTNLGGFLAPLVCGTLGELYGWHWGFGAAGVGMVTGLIIYIRGGRHLPAEGIDAGNLPEARSSRTPGRNAGFLLAVGLVVILFRTAYEQIGNTVALWAESGIDRDIGTVSIPMTWFQSINPLVVFSLAPLLIVHWQRRAARGQDRSAVAKMSLGAALVALAFLLLSAVAFHAEANGTTPSWAWLVLFFVLITIGELHVLPIGLGLFARMAPQRYASTVIASWYLASFAGNLVAGVFGTLWSRLSHGAFFLMTAIIAGAAAAAFLLLDRMTGSRSAVGTEVDEAADMRAVV